MVYKALKFYVLKRIFISLHISLPFGWSQKGCSEGCGHLQFIQVFSQKLVVNKGDNRRNVSVQFSLSLATLNSNSVNQLPLLASPGTELRCPWAPIWKALERSPDTFTTILPGKFYCYHFQRRQLKLKGQLKPKGKLSQSHGWLIGGHSSIRIKVCLILSTMAYLVIMIIALAEKATLLGHLEWIG